MSIFMPADRVQWGFCIIDYFTFFINYDIFSSWNTRNVHQRSNENCLFDSVFCLACIRHQGMNSKPLPWMQWTDSVRGDLEIIGAWSWMIKNREKIWVIIFAMTSTVLLTWEQLLSHLWISWICGIIYLNVIFE